MRTMEVSEPWFSHIQSGVKTIEGRKNSPTWEWVVPGTEFLMTCGNQKMKVRCVDVALWPSIRSYLEGEGLDVTLPGILSIEEGESIYLQWSNEEEVKKYGFKAIHVKVM